MKDGRQLLLEEMTARRNRNSSYSLRAFARDLGISPAALSQYLSRQRELSPKNKRQIIENLRLSPQESAGLMDRPKTSGGTDLGESHEKLTEDRFQMIADWVSVAILNLARLSKNKADPSWIAERLNIDLSEAQEALERLRRLAMIQVKGGRLHRTSRTFMTTTDVPSAAIQRFHVGLIHRAEKALLNLPVEARDVTAITMPTDPSRLAQAKKILQQTRHRIAKLLDNGEPSDIYVLSMQLFPLTQQEGQASPTTVPKKALRGRGK